MIAPDPDLSGDLTLQAGGFWLQPLNAGDAEDLFTHFADPAVVEFMDIDPFDDVEQALHVIGWAAGQRALGAGIRWSIRDADGSFVGTCGFNRLIIERGRRGEIAYDLGRSWWGGGVMALIVPVLIDFGFRRLGLHRLEAMVTPGNVRSCRLLERHGFVREGELQGYGYWKGRYWNQIVYGKVAAIERTG